MVLVGQEIPLKLQLPDDNNYQSFIAAQISDPDIRPGNQVSRIREHNHHRDVADTMSYSDTWGSAFIQSPGDAMVAVFQMPADGIIKGVNVPVNEWGTGDQELIVALYELTYPLGIDTNGDSIRYPQTTIDGAGWIGGYDMIPDSGGMSFLTGAYTPPGTPPECDGGVSNVADCAYDPLGMVDYPFGPPPPIPLQGLIWPDGFIYPTLNPVNNPGNSDEILDNWINTADYGTEPVLTAGTWVGVMVYFSGAGGGDDEPTAFWYADAQPLGLNDPWVALKFYAGCGGTSGSGGWHIRHWVFNFELAVLLTGDRGPTFGEEAMLSTTIPEEAADYWIEVFDDALCAPTGVVSVILHYQLDSLTASVHDVVMTGNEDIYSASIPGQAGGSMIYYWVEAADVGGNVTSTFKKSYYVFPSRQGKFLFFVNTNDIIYGPPVNYPYIFYEWGTDAFDVWGNPYGNIGADVVANYDVIVEITSPGGSPEYDTDAILQPWFALGNKIYVAEGDEWLMKRYGWPGSDIPVGDFARDIGIAHYYDDINGGDISRLFPVAGDEVGGPMAAFLVDSNCVLDYDPQYDPGNANWLDGIDIEAGAIVAYEGHNGEVDINTGASSGTTTYITGIYGTYGSSKAAFFSFDIMSLYARDYSTTSTTEYWVGAWDNHHVSPIRLFLDWAGAELNVNDRTDAAPQEIVLRGNYPNPFNPVTTIRYELPERTDLRLTIYDLLGREVAVLANGVQGTGIGEVRWDAANVASGIYFYRLQAGDKMITSKLVVLK